MAKRKAEVLNGAAGDGERKRRALSSDEAQSKFRNDLFSPKVRDDYQYAYAQSEP